MVNLVKDFVFLVICLTVGFTIAHGIITLIE
jgi:hypothetical protein